MSEEENKGPEEAPRSLKDKINKEMKSLFDVPLLVSVVLGETELTINDLLRLQIGSVIEVDKLAGEPLEVLINKKEVARGEVLIVNDNYGLRLTDIIDPSENAIIKDTKG